LATITLVSDSNEDEPQNKNTFIKRDKNTFDDKATHLLKETKTHLMAKQKRIFNLDKNTFIK
jgi:hypothetical protein